MKLMINSNKTILFVYSIVTECNISNEKIVEINKTT